MERNKAEIYITPGDPHGIGPEVTEKALVRLKTKLARTQVSIVGSRAPYKKNSALFKMKNIRFIEPPAASSPGQQVGWSIETATKLIQEKSKFSALVTGPLNKEVFRGAGYNFQGHTDFLASLTGTESVTMVLANEWFRVALVTTHCPLQKVSTLVDSKAISRVFEHCYSFATQHLNRKKPKIAFLGLNPHAGENGILGSEEIKTIIPTMNALREKFPAAIISGPHSSDSFFVKEKSLPKKDRHDFIIAMYHDQGLIPVKLSDFQNCMNFTLGLPIIRTSVDHGTAFDIAGKNKADPSSMIYAIKGAQTFITQRSKT